MPAAKHVAGAASMLSLASIASSTRIAPPSDNFLLIGAAGLAGISLVAFLGSMSTAKR